MSKATETAVKLLESLPEEAQGKVVAELREAVQIGQRGARRVSVSHAPLMLLPVNLPPPPPLPRQYGVEPTQHGH